ncbi:glyceraldehyde 3-phosphate dehydrogenase NAD-binding domain-containing protein [Paenibacillus sp. FSL W8-1187]|uniref:type I glyceraldehyde-3-phosphate dehydrogenase n=1 Tax=Paenibacillus sp. FSL W8-1187 TaxID=2975339 RepID=UPI0030D94BAC
MRIAINGTGRIGRLCIRRLLDLADGSELELVAVNTTCTPDMLVHLLEYDTVHGRWPGRVRTDGGALVRLEADERLDRTGIPPGRSSSPQPSSRIDSAPERNPSTQNRIEPASDRNSSPQNRLEPASEQSSSPQNWIEPAPERNSSPQNRIELVSERDPSRLPWRRLGIDLVIDATGAFTDRAGMEKHLEAGAGRVLLTSPGEADLTAVMGVNDERFDPSVHRFVSAASCTTNCLAPVLKAMHEAFGVRGGWATSIHAFTSDQNHLDNPHRDWRRARSCGASIVPAATGVSKALREVLPELAPVIRGSAVRVPVADVSLLQLQLELGAPAAADEVREALREAAAGPLAPYVGYADLPLVSADYIGCDKSAVVDGPSVLARGSSVQLSAWYDNEWGYACRVVDLAARIAERASAAGRLGGAQAVRV